MSSPKNPIPMNDLARLLERLGLRALARHLQDFLTRATTHKWTPTTVLEQLAALESEDKAHRSLERRLKRSRLGRFKPMADFDWSWPKHIDRPAIDAALGLDFIPEGRNFILLGPNGIGKTMILKNIAHNAVLAGHSVLYRTAAELLDELDCDSPEQRRHRLRKYFRPRLVCVDELGYLSYDDHAADLLYHVVNPRYEARRALALTSNLAFKDWGTVFPNAPCLTTLLDRLTHHADVTVLQGQSYRARESELENSERRKRRPKPPAKE